MNILTYRFNNHQFLYQQLYQFIKEDILSGRLQPNDKLPSKRRLSQHLAISRTTIEIAYQQLQDEGYIYSRPKIGYFTEDISTINSVPINKEILSLPAIPKPALSFKIEDSHDTTFPFQSFRKYARDAFEVENADLLERGDKQGEYILRNEIRRYLYHSRGVNCTNDQIIVGSSTEQLFTTAVHILKGDFLVENPGYPMIRKVLRFNRRDYHNIDVDEEGIIVNELKNKGQIVHVTPSHQFPTGAVLSARRRSELLKWAAEVPERFIIEDDYDSEFRYKGRPFKALQGMDNGEKVIYMSTFSKSIYPSIRMAYMVLPDTLLERYHKLEDLPMNTVPRHMQYIVAKFMENGDFERNINRMRKIYKRKLDITLDAIKTYDSAIQVSGEDAGMHFIIDLKQSITSNNQPILFNTLADYYHGTYKYDNKLILAFGGLELEKIRENVQQLMEHINQQMPSFKDTNA